MPSSWVSKRKNITFITRPNPGAHKREYSCSILVLLRDLLGYVKNSREAKYAVKNTEIVINGKRCTDPKQPVGIFDIIEIKETSDIFTLVFNESGKLKLLETKDNTLISKISGKRALKNSKFQLNLFNGYNVLITEKEFKTINVNDSIVYDFGKNKVVKHLPLKEGNFVFVYDGKFKGYFAEVKGFTEYNGLATDIVQIKIGNEEHNTAKKYCYVIGDKKEDLKRFS